MERVMEEIKQLFINFLLDNNCYSQAQTNFLEEMKVTVEEWVENYTREPREILNYGFHWFMSPEGYGYWCDIDDLWREKLKEMNLYNKKF